MFLCAAKYPVYKIQGGAKLCWLYVINVFLCCNFVHIRVFSQRTEGQYCLNNFTFYEIHISTCFPNMFAVDNLQLY